MGDRFFMPASKNLKVAAAITICFFVSLALFGAVGAGGYFAFRANLILGCVYVPFGFCAVVCGYLSILDAYIDWLYANV
jgi:fatty acid desaturase